MKTSVCAAIAAAILVLGLAVPGWADNGPAGIPQVGSINYVEGHASIDGSPLSPNSAGTARLESGQTLSTQTGRVELLLTPGVFLRVDDNSTLAMISSSLAPTEVQLDAGRAMVEVTYIQKENNIRVGLDGASVKLVQKGLYEFDADHGQVRVFKGKAFLYEGNRKVKMTEGREVNLEPGVKVKAVDFKTSQFEDNFYDWCRLRSGYLLQADANLATQYSDGWYGPDWYWDPWFSAWAFPYGWGWGGYYSPFFGYGVPFYYGRGFGGRGFGDHDRGIRPRWYTPGGMAGRTFGPRGSGGRAFGGFRGGFHGGGFHGGGFGGGGFHGGGHR